jgi:hypothetical protein
MKLKGNINQFNMKFWSSLVLLPLTFINPVLRIRDPVHFLPLDPGSWMGRKSVSGSDPGWTAWIIICRA